MSKKYNDGVKKNVVDDYEKGMLVKEIVEKYRIPRSTICDWIYQGKTRVNIHNKKYTLSQIDILKKKVIENEVKLNACIALIRKADISELTKLETCKELYSSGQSLNLIYPLFMIEKRKFYRFLKRESSMTQYKKKDIEITPLIKEIFEKSKGRFGPQKIKIKLEKTGYPNISQKKISQIMKDNNLLINAVKTKVIYQKGNKDTRLKNTLNRNFSVEEPNTVWVSDITYIKVNGINRYLCVIIDLFSRKIVGWKVSTTNSESLPINTFRKAFFDRGSPTNLLFHTDRGSNYTTNKLRNLLKACEVKHSFSNTGNPYDNAVIESFFATFKKELTNLKVYETVVELKQDVNEYMDYFNSYRPHRYLNNKTPDEFEAMYQKKSLKLNNDRLNKTNNY